MAEMNILKGILLVMIFYSFATTIVAHTFPSSSERYLQVFNPASTTDITDTASKVQESIDSQMNIPIIEIGALVFYSGNIVVDLFLNFALAIPEMLTILINGILLLVSLPTNIATTIKLFSFALFTIFYMLGIVQLFLNVRSGRLI